MGLKVRRKKSFSGYRIENYAKRQVFPLYLIY